MSQLNEPTPKRLAYLPPMSQDIIITHRGRRVLWAERLFARTVVPLVRWYFRLVFRWRQ